MERPVQETTSTYFNAILRRNVQPLTVDALPAAVVEEFDAHVRSAFPQDAEAAVERVKYLIPYILQAIDWDEYGIPLQAWQLKYYYDRERFLARTRLSFSDFANHQFLQAAIAELGLDAEPTFEFLLFLKYYYDLRSELRHSCVEQLHNVLNALSALGPDRNASLDIAIDGKHFKFNNTAFVKQALELIPVEKLNADSFVNDFNEGAARDKIRALDYYIVKTLLDYLPVRRIAQRRGVYTQAERNFGLSILSYLGRLPDIDREGECTRENNATFDKLMRDFKDTPIPFAMELFL